jgi:hypothetical protein
VSAEASLFIRLYLDEDVHKRVAAALRLRGFDVVSAHEIGRWGFSDELQLTYASSEERAIFTYNAPDYLELHRDWLQQGKDHFGIIVSDQLPMRETVRRLLSLLNRVAADEMRNQILWLQAFS